MSHGFRPGPSIAPALSSAHWRTATIAAGVRRCTGNRAQTCPADTVGAEKVPETRRLWSSLNSNLARLTKMPLRLAILALPALALVPKIAPLRAPRAAQLFSVVERGTSSLEDTEGLGLCEKSTSASGAPDNSSLSHFSAMTWLRWTRRAMRNRHRHAIEQAARRWRGGRTRRKI